MKNVRTRFAPSPTGFVHIGSMHNVFFAHALAKANDGDFILRIEDTDRKRYVEGAVEELYAMLDEFGLTPDEGPREGGKYAPYIQSERMKSGIYKTAAEELVKKGNAYYCFLSSNELEELKKKPEYKNKAFRSPHRNLSKSEVEARILKGEKYVIRLKVPENEIVAVDDAILGHVEWNTDDIDDQVLIKSDGFPTYHLAVVIDDHVMNISHITRAYEWLPSTPKQMLLYKYLDYDVPIFAHGSLVLDPDGGKLSKRKGNVNTRQFLVEGYLVDAIKNFLMLLGWAAPIERIHGEKEREIFSHEEFINMYKLEDRQKTNAVFDRNKLLWFNQKYISTMNPEELEIVLENWLEKYAEIENELKDFVGRDNALPAKLELVKDRAKTLLEVVEGIQFFYKARKDINWKIKQVEKFAEKLSRIGEDVLEFHKSLDENSKEWAQEEWVEGMKKIAEKHGLKTGDPFMVLRIAIVGSPFSPPLFEALKILGKDEILRRLQNANYS
ncbi:glutamate--tRNA ligase [Candidatus Dojkabacteria bacterium]|nr:glutamate--tRNA ligase [Candidatus Dojkabacteria bacterium]